MEISTCQNLGIYMLSVGIAQIPNSVDVSKNFEAIQIQLQKFEKQNVDLIVFPECSLSGFAATMRECTETVLSPYFEKIQNWTNQTGIEVVLPTAIAEADKVFNSGYWFKKNSRERFIKMD
jgi:predicted amidohydrolase